MNNNLHYGFFNGKEHTPQMKTYTTPHNYAKVFADNPEFFGGAKNLEGQVRATDLYFPQNVQDSILNTATSSLYVAPVLGNGTLIQRKNSQDYVSEFSLFGTELHGKPAHRENWNNVVQRFAGLHTRGLRLGARTVMVGYCPHLKGHYCHYQDKSPNAVLSTLHHESFKQEHPASDAALEVLNGGPATLERLEEAMSVFVSMYNERMVSEHDNVSQDHVIVSYDAPNNQGVFGQSTSIYSMSDSTFFVAYTKENIMGQNHKDYNPIVGSYIDLTYLMGNTVQLYAYMDILLRDRRLQDSLDFRQDSRIARTGTIRSIFESGAVEANVRDTETRRKGGKMVDDIELPTLVHDAALLQKVAVLAFNLGMGLKRYAMPYTYASEDNIYGMVFERLVPAMQDEVSGKARLGYHFVQNPETSLMEPEPFDVNEAMRLLSELEGAFRQSGYDITTNDLES